MDLTEQVNRTIAEHKLFEPGDRIVVAVSGGPDSTALLHLLFLLSGRWGWELVAAHANHGFRPEESLQEAEFVRGQAEERGIPFVYKELDVPAYLSVWGGNSQVAARRLRYCFLMDTAREWRADRIALAHHADDQAETVLMRVLRGTGISGLAGIPRLREENGVKLVRPLLGLNKKALIDELSRLGIGYCFDSSNAKLTYTRNRLRLEAMPQLSRYNPSLVEALNRLAELAAADDELLELEAAEAFRRMACVQGEKVCFSQSAFAGLHVALQRRFIKLILNYLSLKLEHRDFAVVEQVRNGLLEGQRPNADMAISGKIRLMREYDTVSILADPGLAEKRGPRDYLYILDGPHGRIFIPEAEGWLIYEAISAQEAAGKAPSSHSAYFDAEVLDGPLIVRNRRDGDRIRVDGLNGTKKVKDIFIDDKVPASLRERTPILTDAQGALLWIAGIRRSGFARVTEKTRQVFRIVFCPQADGQIEDEKNVPF